MAGSDKRPDGVDAVREPAAGAERVDVRDELQAERLRVVLVLRPALHKIHRNLQKTRRRLRPDGPPLEETAPPRNARVLHDPHVRNQTAGHLL